MTTSPVIPQPDQVIAVARTFEELATALRTMKNILGLSNEFCDEIGGLTKGHTDKIIGPTRTKNWGPMSFDTLCEMFAVEFRMVINIDAMKRMEKRWEGRDKSNVRMEPNRVSKQILDRATPHVLRANGSLGGTARKAKLTARQLTEIGRKGARFRWRKWRERKRAARAAAMDRMVRAMNDAGID